MRSEESKDRQFQAADIARLLLELTEKRPVVMDALQTLLEALLAPRQEAPTPIPAEPHGAAPESPAQPIAEAAPDLIAGADAATTLDDGIDELPRERIDSPSVPDDEPDSAPPPAAPMDPRDRAKAEAGMKSLLSRYADGFGGMSGRGGLAKVETAAADSTEIGYWDDEADTARQLARLARAQARRLRSIRRARHAGESMPRVDGVIADERIEDWTTDAPLIEQLEAKDLREGERWYRAATASLLEVAEWLESHPKTPLGEGLTPAELHARLQCVATAQKGIYCWLDEHVARSHDSAWRTCGVQLRIYQQLASSWTKNFRTKLECMRRDERITSDARVAVERALGRFEVECAPGETTVTAERLAKEPGAPRSPAEAHEAGFDSVLEAFEAARQEFSNASLVFTERAFESAECSAFRRPAEVHAFFRALQEVATMLAQGLHEDPFHLLLERGFPSKPSNPQTMARHRRFYFMMHEGREISLSQHVTLGSRNQNTCLSIHWWHDSARKRFVIGHCGKHLPNTRS
ncbi:MAG: hypothetical protein RIT24_1140 [Planctomycetota bacterium]